MTLKNQYSWNITNAALAQSFWRSNFLKEIEMGKSQDAKKETKKQPQKTPKEKKQAKQEKKAAKNK